MTNKGATKTSFWLIFDEEKFVDLKRLSFEAQSNISQKLVKSKSNICQIWLVIDQLLQAKNEKSSFGPKD